MWPAALPLLSTCCVAPKEPLRGTLVRLLFYAPNPPKQPWFVNPVPTIGRDEESQPLRFSNRQDRVPYDGIFSRLASDAVAPAIGMTGYS